MTDETGFLRAILNEPGNNDLRLIYADWLEEQNDPVAAAKAEFLRLTVQGPDLPAPEPKKNVPAPKARKTKLVRDLARQLFPTNGMSEAELRQQRLRELAAELGTDWLAVTSRLPVENCPTRRKETARRDLDRPPFQFLCDRRWQDLRATEDGTVRFCEGCQQQVHYCGTIGEARDHAEEGHCIAIDLGIVRRDRDLRPPASMMVLGRPSPDFLREEEERLKPDPVSVAREQRKQQTHGRAEVGE